MRRNTVGIFADNDRKLDLMISPAIWMTHSDRLRGANHRTGSFEEETHTLNLGDPVTVMNFRILTRLTKCRR